MAAPLKKGSTSCAGSRVERGGLVIAKDAKRADIQSGWVKAELNGPTVQQLAWVKLPRVFPSQGLP